jgi:tRNA (adenine57-N1/adenine58-N1)-methyltransferase
MFKEGDFVLLVDRKNRKYIIELKKDTYSSFHFGKVQHNDIIDKNPSFVFSSNGEKLLVLKPTTKDFVLYKLKRKSQIIYPKDVGQILVLSDIFNAKSVFECGCGSGALTMWLLQAKKDETKLVSIDCREDMVELAKKNIETYFKKPIEEIKNFVLEVKKLEEVDYEENTFDRVILDVTEPWLYLDKITKILSSYGILLCWLPTVLQVFNLIDEVEKKYSEHFYLEGIYETLQREWQKNQLALRPKDRMVAHTGFLIVFRKQ